MLERRPRGEPLRERIDDGGSGPLGKSRKRKRRPGIGAACGGASQNAAKTVMLTTISARCSRTGTVEATIIAANSARKCERGRRRRRGEEALQQKRVKHDRANRGAPCKRLLAKTPHPQGPQRVPLSRSHSSKDRRKMVGVRGFEPPAPSSRTRCATRLRYTPARRRKFSPAALCFAGLIAAPGHARKPRTRSR
jgi:hypothetical protein